MQHFEDMELFGDREISLDPSAGSYNYCMPSGAVPSGYYSGCINHAQQQHAADDGRSIKYDRVIIINQR